MGKYSIAQPSSNGSAPEKKKVDYSKPLDKKKTAVSYSVDTHTLLLDIATSSESASKSAAMSAVAVKNDGNVSALAIFGYQRYTDETTEGNTEYVHYLLAPDEEITIPATRAIIVDSLDQFDGTAVTATAPDSNMYVASGCLLDEGSNITDSVTNFTVDDGDYFEIGDLIRLDNEIM